MCREARWRPVGLETTAEDKIREVMGGLMMKLHSECDGKSLEFFEQKTKCHDLNCNFPGPLSTDELELTAQGFRSWEALRKRLQLSR